LKFPESLRTKEDQHLLRHIKQFWLESGGHYGYRNIHLDLQQAKIACGRDRVLRLIQQERLKAQRGYRKPRGYYNGSISAATGNHLNRVFIVDEPNQWWVSDITYIHTQQGFLFLAVVMDLYARNMLDGQ
jgi:putative transposase